VLPLPGAPAAQQSWKNSPSKTRQLRDESWQMARVFASQLAAAQTNSTPTPGLQCTTAKTVNPTPVNRAKCFQPAAGEFARVPSRRRAATPQVVAATARCGITRHVLPAAGWKHFAPIGPGLDLQLAVVHCKPGLVSNWFWPPPVDWHNTRAICQLRPAIAGFARRVFPTALCGGRARQRSTSAASCCLQR